MRLAEAPVELKSLPLTTALADDETDVEATPLLVKDPGT